MSSIGNPAARSTSTCDTPAPAGPAQHRAHHVRQVGQPAAQRDRACFQPRHVEQVADETVQPLRLLLDGVEHGGPGCLVQGAVPGRQAGGGTEDGGERRAQVVRDGGQQGRAQPVGLRLQARLVDVAHQVDPFHRQRRLVGQGVQQPLPVRGQQRPRLVTVDAEHARRATPGVHGQEQPLAAGQGVGATAGRPVVLPRPARRRQVAAVQGVVGREPGLHRQAVRTRQQHHHPHVEHQRHLVHGRPQHVVQRPRGGQLAAELVQLVRGLGPGTGGLRLVSHARRQVAGDDGHDGEHGQGDDVLRVGDGERVERRQEEEVVGEHAHQAGQQRCRQPISDRAGQHAHEQHEGNAGQAQDLPQQHRHAQRGGHREHAAAPRARRRQPPTGALRRVGALPGRLVLGQDVDVDAAGPADHAMRHRAPEQLRPVCAAGWRHDDVGEVVAPRVLDHRRGDIRAGHRRRLAAEPFGQPQRVRRAGLAGLVPPTATFHVDRRPGAAKPVGDAAGLTHQRGASGSAIDVHQHAVAGAPRAADGVAAHVVDHLVVHALGRAPQRQLAQRRQVAGLEVVADRPLGLVRDVDLAVLQPLDQVLRGEVDDLDVVRPVDDRVRHRFAHADAGDACDHVVQALDVLDVERGVDVDPGRQHLLHVEEALGMPAVRSIGVGQLVDQHQPGAAGKHRIEVHLVHGPAPVVHLARGQPPPAPRPGPTFPRGHGSRRCRRPRRCPRAVSHAPR